MMAIGAYTCHQKGERSFFYHGYQFPVCARCTGLAVGYVLGVLAWFYGGQLSVLFSILMMLPTLIDGLLQYKTRYHSTNLRRCSSGILAGVGCIQLLAHLLSHLG